MKRGGIEHPKTKRLSRLLGIPLVYAVGVLESLFHATARYARRGDIGRFSDQEVADLCQWEGDAGELVRALVAAGWVDECATYRLIVHDWKDHADETTKKSLTRSGEAFVTRVVLGSVETKSAAVQTCSDMQSGHGCLPDPVPVPVPVPSPEDNPLGGAGIVGDEAVARGERRGEIHRLLIESGLFMHGAASKHARAWQEFGVERVREVIEFASDKYRDKPPNIRAAMVCSAMNEAWNVSRPARADDGRARGADADFFRGDAA
jgi:hypothetical protein